MPKMVGLAIWIGPCVYEALRIFGLPARVPVTVDGELEDGVADQSKALIGLCAESRGCVECLSEQSGVLEGVAESVTDILEGIEGASLLLEATLHLFLCIGGGPLALGGGSSCGGMGRSDVVGRCSDHVVRKQGGDGGGRRGNYGVGGHDVVFVGRRGVDLPSRRGVGVLGGSGDDIFGRRGVVLVGRHCVDVA